VALPEAETPVGIALGIMGSTRPSHHVEVTTLREGLFECGVVFCVMCGICMLCLIVDHCHRVEKPICSLNKPPLPLAIRKTCLRMLQLIRRYRSATSPSHV
jgi:hypothetical protein